MEAKPSTVIISKEVSFNAYELNIEFAGGERVISCFKIYIISLSVKGFSISSTAADTSPH